MHVSKFLSITVTDRQLFLCCHIIKQMRELGSKFNLLMKHLIWAEYRPLFKSFNATFIIETNKTLNYKVANSIKRGHKQVMNPFFLCWWSVRFWQRAGMRKAAYVCSSCSMHQCLWDGSPGLGPDGCQDTGWAHYPDIIKRLKWEPLGITLFVFLPLISVHYCDGVIHSHGWTTCWRCAIIVSKTGKSKLVI